jgi:hypothetical protein
MPQPILYLIRYINYTMNSKKYSFLPESFKFLTINKIGKAQLFTVVVIFSVLYFPFLKQYGWGYRNIDNVDLPSFYSASVEVFRNSGSPYNHEILKTIMGPDIVFGPYFYPPPSLLFFYPLSLLEYSSAKVVLLLFNHVIILLLIGLISNYMVSKSNTLSTHFHIVTIVYTLTFYPIIVTINHGQVNLLLLLFLIIFWISTLKNKPILASFFLALAVLLKTYPIILIPILFVIGRKRETFYTILWLFSLITLSLFLLPISIWQEWFTEIMPTGSYASTPAGLFSPAAIWNQSLNGFFARAFTESQWSNPLFIDIQLARYLTYISAGLVFIVTLVSAWKGFLNKSVGMNKALMAALPAIYLVAPLSWEHHLVYLLPTILLLLTAKSNLSLFPTVIFHLLSILCAIIIAMPHVIQFKFYAVFIVWCLCIFALINNRIEIPDSSLIHENPNA